MVGDTPRVADSVDAQSIGAGLNKANGFTTPHIERLPTQRCFGGALGNRGDGLAGLCSLLNHCLTADHFAAHWFGMA